MRSLPFWLMMVSIATAVLPVWRSPMMSSRWPRPMGIMLSIAFRPVCTGVLTGWRKMTPGGTRLVVFFDVCIIAQDSAANRLLFKVEGHAHQPGASKFYQLEIFHILQAIDAGDAILYRDHGTDTGR